MKAKSISKALAMILAVVMVFGMLPLTGFAATVDYTEEADDYYKMISQKEWELAPGIVESEIVLNNDAGDRRQVMHVVEVDIHNEYTKVIPSSKGMIPTPGKYGVETMDKQAAYAEANGYGNVVAAMNISLSWYDSTYYDNHPELVGEPLGYLILDGVQYTNSQGKTAGAQTCLVINFDEKDGVARPADIPKTQIRSTADAITGWEEQVIPANFGFLVKDGKMVNTKEEHTSEGASRSMLGIKADGSIIMVMNDGRQAPYSTGFNNYEMSEAMLKLGCVYAINGDGGGSSQFLSQRPGEELSVNCAPSDGALRATTHGILVISTAPSTGEFVRAHVESEHEYYTPGSSVQFTAIGSDLAGTAAEIPAEASWQLADASYGTIDSNGLFVSNGKLGNVTAQLIYNGEVTGSASINIVTPDAIAFGTAAAYTVPFGESVNILVTATYGVYDVALKASDYTITFGDATLGTLSGNTYTAGNTKGSTDMTVTLNADTSVNKTIPLTVGKGSEVVFSFEEGTIGANLSNWQIKDHEGKYPPYSDLSIVTAENGMVHNGTSALAVHMPNHQHVDGGEGYNANSITWIGDPILLENATAIGMWVYIPEEATQTEIALNYVWYNDQGVQQRTTPDLCLNDYFNDIEASGWYYLSVPISKSEAYIENATEVAAKQGYKRNFFLKFYVTNSGNAGDESSYSGDITYYIDDVTVDYSSAVADRVNPTINATYAKNISSDSNVTLTAAATANLSSGSVSFTAEVTDNLAVDAASARVYVDGLAVSATFKNGRVTSSDMVLGAGVHRVEYAIADAAGNVSKAVRYVCVSGTDVAVNVVAHNPEQTTALTGSVYWVDVVANEAEKISKVTLKLDLDTMHTWQLAYAELADNYAIEYYYASVADQDDNVITVVLTNNGSDVTGNAVIASLPVRVWSYCGNAASSSITPAEAWTKGYVTAVSVNVEVEYGQVVYTDNTSTTFSAKKLHADTEAYIHQYKMDKTYFANNTYHVHTETALEDKAPTCVQKGYTGRTYCEVCASVVDWGTTVDATGHSYSVVENLLVCGCGELFNGVYTDGNTYIDGILVTDGWFEKDGVKLYYFENGEKLTGSHYMDGVMYTFGEDGVYQPDFKYDGFYTFGDKVMFFVNNEFLTGAQTLANTAYYFDENGYGYEGKFVILGEDCTFSGGKYVSCANPEVLDAGWCGKKVEYVVYADGLLKLGGSGATFQYKNNGHGNRQFIDYLEMITKVEIGKDITFLGENILAYLIATEVVFEEGSALTNISTSAFLSMPRLDSIDIPEGVTAIGVNAFKNCTGLRRINVPESVTTINAKAFAGCSSALVFHVKEGSYAETYAKDNGWNYTYDSFYKNGFYEENGELYYYVDGVKWLRRGLFQVDGAYYYAKTDGSLLRNIRTWASVTNDLLPKDIYDFDANGKLVMKNGFVEEDGELYYYVEGTKWTRRGLFEVDGAYYYAKADGSLLRNTRGWASVTNDLLPKDIYDFGADGKLVMKNGFVEEDGELYYYVDGTKWTRRGIFQVGEDYYYAKADGSLLRNTRTWASVTNDLLPKAIYDFDANGKMILG